MLRNRQLQPTVSFYPVFDTVSVLPFHSEGCLIAHRCTSTALLSSRAFPLTDAHTAVSKGGVVQKQESSLTVHWD